MPQRARDRSALASSHPLLHARDDRAIEVGRQKIEHPKDRRRSKQLHWSSSDREWLHAQSPHDAFRRARGGRPLQVGVDEMRMHGPSDDGRHGPFGIGIESVFESETRRTKGQTVDLWEIAKPGRIRRDLPKGYEVVPRLKDVIMLDDVEASDEDEYEFVERMPAPANGRNTKGKGKGREKSFARAVQGKQRTR